MGSVRFFKHYIRSTFLLLALVELLVFVLSVYASAYFRFLLIDPDSPVDFAALFPRAAIISITMVLSMAAMGLYQGLDKVGFQGASIRIVVAILFGAAGLGLFSYMFRSLEIYRGTLVFTLMISLVAIMIVRYTAYSIRPWLFRQNVLVLGASDCAKAVLDSGGNGFNLLGFLPVEGEEITVPEKLLLGAGSSLVDLVKEKSVDEVVVALTDRRGMLPIAELLNCKMKGVGILNLLQYFERERGIVKLDMLNPSWLVFSDGFHQGSLTNIVKRTFDIGCSLILLFFTWPIMIIVAIAISIESGFSAPVIYGQTRVGENARFFEVLKFRSMDINAEPDGQAQWAAENDTRITKVGRVIRKLRIDELPQIINILRGDMSFVGPRPERPEFVALLEKKNEYYRERHRVKPGLTGWAQLNYPYGSSEQGSLKKLEYDLYYIKNNSLFLDMVIILRTVEVVLFGKGAL